MGLNLKSINIQDFHIIAQCCKLCYSALWNNDKNPHFYTMLIGSKEIIDHKKAIKELFATAAATDW